jgi:excisionase family DNA binding protein
MAFFIQEVISIMIAKNDIFLTAAEVMAILQFPKSTFYSYVKQGFIPSHKIGHRLRFKRSEILNIGK